jgi:hypothetical protein
MLSMCGRAYVKVGEYRESVYQKFVRLNFKKCHYALVGDREADSNVVGHV